MRFFIISENGDAAGLAWRLQNEGNEVLIWFKNPHARLSLKGMVPQVPSIRAGKNQNPDVIIFDMVGMGKVADELRQQGYKVIGASAWADRLEFDRKFSMKVMTEFGIKTPRSFSVKNIAEAIDFAKGHTKLLVAKPHGNMNTAFTFVPKTQDELIGFLLHLREDLGIDGRILLQEFIKGTEVSTELWYAQGRPVPYPNSTFETKKLMYGDVGPSTGAQTSLVFAYPNRQPRLIQQSLKKIEVFLRRTQYSGPLDINGIVRNGKFYGLEFTPRLGYNALYAFMRILKEPIGKVLGRIANGDASPMNLKTGFGYALRVSVPPYPYKPEDKKLQKDIYKDSANLSIGGLSKAEWEEMVFPLDVWKSKHGLRTAGFDGVVLETTGHGESPFDAEAEAVRLFRKLVLPQKQARLGDGARVAERRLCELRNQGYEMPPFDSKPIPLSEAEMPMDVATGKKIKEVNKDETKPDSTVDLADKLGVRRGSFVDPRIASN